MDRLAPQPWMTAAQRVMDALETARPGSARFVGGCVRNALLGEPVSDIDIATQLTPDEVERVMLAAGIAVHPTGIEHGTLTVVADHKPYEVTTLRRDVETDGRRAVVAFTQDWAEDAQRRDFRINALYAGRDGQLFDPTGGGLDDLKHRRVIFVGDPEMRVREDYLRILRFFRFYAWYGVGEPDAAGMAACAKLRTGMDGISPERIWMELKKILQAPQPLSGLEAMRDAGVLVVLLPKVKTLELLRKVVALGAERGEAPDPLLRLLALFENDETSLQWLQQRLRMSTSERRRLNLPSIRRALVTETMLAREVRAVIYSYDAQMVRDIAFLGLAETGSAAWRDILAIADTWQAPVMPINGADLITLGFTQGEQLGIALDAARKAWIASDFTLDRDALLALVR